MASENTDDSGSTGCAKKGCGCMGVVVAIAAVSWLVDLVFFYYPFASWGIVVSGGLLLAGGIAGLPLGATVTAPASRRRMKTAGTVILGFGALCLVTAIGMSLRPSSFSYEEQVSPEGGTVGPFEISEGDTRVGVRVLQHIDEGRGSVYQRWSFVTVELLDENQEYLASFGGEFWRYAGYDDGHWEEEDEAFETTLRVPTAGTYYARLQTESNVSTSELGSVTLQMQERAWWGYPVPLRMAAYIAFLVGAALFVAPYVGQSSKLVTHLSDGGRIRFQGQTWRVRNEVQYEYDDWKATEWILHPTDSGTKTPRYLEREYETDSNWESWLVSQPVDFTALQADESDGPQKNLQNYVSARGTLPDAVIFEDTRYSLEDGGRARREGTPFTYHLYEADTGGFVTIEGEPGDTLEAVVGRKVSVSELSVVEENPS